VFFVLSGYLISQTLERRLSNPKATFADFAIDRWARIYSGFLPALLLIAGIDYVATMGPYGVNGETLARYTWELFFANLFMLQDPGYFLPFGSAAPFWTVAVEFWIYLFVGQIAFAVRDGLTAPRVLLILACGVIPVHSAFWNHGIFWPWLLGVAAQQIVSGGILRRVPAWLLCLMAALVVLWLAIIIGRGDPVYSAIPYLLCSVAFLFASEASTRLKAFGRLAIISNWASGWSYSLYLLHHSLLMLIASKISASAALWGGISGSIAIAIAFAALTEAHHRQLGALTKRMFGLRRI